MSSRKPKGKGAGVQPLQFSKEEVSDTPHKAKSALAYLLSESPKKKPRALSESFTDAQRRGSNCSNLSENYFSEDRKAIDRHSSELLSPNAGSPLLLPFQASIHVAEHKLELSMTISGSVSLVLGRLAECFTLVEDNETQDELESQLLLRVADTAGSIDPDYPVLDPATSMHQLGVHAFVLSSFEPTITIQGRQLTWAEFCAGGLSTTELLIGPKQDKPNSTPKSRLFFAAENGEIDIVQSIIDSKLASVNCTGIDNFTPLHFAARAGHLPVVNYILKQEELVDINTHTKNGWTPLHLACHKNHLDVVETLLVCGADPSKETAGGLTAFSIAQQKDYGELLDLLEEFRDEDEDGVEP